MTHLSSVQGREGDKDCKWLIIFAGSGGEGLHPVKEALTQCLTQFVLWGVKILFVLNSFLFVGEGRKLEPHVIITRASLSCLLAVNRPCVRLIERACARVNRIGLQYIKHVVICILSGPLHPFNLFTLLFCFFGNIPSIDNQISPAFGEKLTKKEFVFITLSTFAR